MERITIWIDSSALVKRYAPEPGSELIDSLFSEVKLRPHLVLTIPLVQYVETYAVLIRKRNSGVITHRLLQSAIATLIAELEHQPSWFRVLALPDEFYVMGMKYIRRYNINTVDAACMALYLEQGYQISSMKVLISADRRLLRAAQMEQIKVLDPEQAALEELIAFLNSLEP